MVSVPENVPSGSLRVWTSAPNSALVGSVRAISVSVCELVREVEGRGQGKPSTLANYISLLHEAVYGPGSEGGRQSQVVCGSGLSRHTGVMIEFFYASSYVSTSHHSIRYSYRGTQARLRCVPTTGSRQHSGKHQRRFHSTSGIGNPAAFAIRTMFSAWICAQYRSVESSLLSVQTHLFDHWRVDHFHASTFKFQASRAFVGEMRLLHLPEYSRRTEDLCSTHQRQAEMDVEANIRAHLSKRERMWTGSCRPG